MCCEAKAKIISGNVAPRAIGNEKCNRVSNENNKDEEDKSADPLVRRLEQTETNTKLDRSWLLVCCPGVLTKLGRSQADVRHSSLGSLKNDECLEDGGPEPSFHSLRRRGLLSKTRKITRSGLQNSNGSSENEDPRSGRVGG